MARFCSHTTVITVRMFRSTAFQFVPYRDVYKRQVCEDQYTVTVKYVMDDADQTEIKTSYVSEEMSKGSPYDVSGQIPDSITYEGQSLSLIHISSKAAAR